MLFKILCTCLRVFVLFICLAYQKENIYKDGSRFWWYLIWRNGASERNVLGLVYLIQFRKLSTIKQVNWIKGETDWSFTEEAPSNLKELHRDVLSNHKPVDHSKWSFDDSWNHAIIKLNCINIDRNYLRSWLWFQILTSKLDYYERRMVKWNMTQY